MANTPQTDLPTASPQASSPEDSADDQVVQHFYRQFQLDFGKPDIAALWTSSRPFNDRNGGAFWLYMQSCHCAAGLRQEIQRLESLVKNLQGVLFSMQAHGHQQRLTEESLHFALTSLIIHSGLIQKNPATKKELEYTIQELQKKLNNLPPDTSNDGMTDPGVAVLEADTDAAIPEAADPVVITKKQVATKSTKPRTTKPKTTPRASKPKPTSSAYFSDDSHVGAV